MCLLLSHHSLHFTTQVCPNILRVTGTWMGWSSVFRFPWKTGVNISHWSSCAKGKMWIWNQPVPRVGTKTCLEEKNPSSEPHRPGDKRIPDTMQSLWTILNQHLNISQPALLISPLSAPGWDIWHLQTSKEIQRTGMTGQMQCKYARLQTSPVQMTTSRI